jgi:hypothetical protein
MIGNAFFFMLLKSYHHLHPLPKAKSYFVYKNDEDNNLDIFEMVAVNNELSSQTSNITKFQ